MRRIGSTLRGFSVKRVTSLARISYKGLWYYCFRAQKNESAYREVASEKVKAENDLKDCRRSLQRVTKQLELFDSREDNLRDLRRQLSECEESAEARIDSITKEAAEINKQKECAEKR